MRLHHCSSQAWLGFTLGIYRFHACGFTLINCPRETVNLYIIWRETLININMDDTNHEMFSVILSLLLQPPPQTGLVIQYDFISRRECRRRQQIHFFQSLPFFVLYLRTRRPVVRQRGRTWIFTRPQNLFQRLLNDVLRRESKYPSLAFGCCLYLNFWNQWHGNVRWHHPAPINLLLTVITSRFVCSFILTYNVSIILPYLVLNIETICFQVLLTFLALLMKINFIF